jgi:flagellar biosynthesis anti-sigma factor FlgM
VRIDSFGSVATEWSQSLTVVDKARSQTAQPATQKTAATEDTTSLSSGAVSVQALTDAALHTTSRADKVEALRQAVSSGQYALDPAKIARAMTKANI